MSEAKQANIEIDLTRAGTGTIKVDGHDISNRIYKVELVGQVGEATEVVLYMRAVSVKVMASAMVSSKMLMLDPDTASEVAE